MSYNYELMVAWAYHVSKLKRFIPNVVQNFVEEFAPVFVMTNIIMLIIVLFIILLVNGLEFLYVTLSEQFFRFVDQGLEIIVSKVFILCLFCSLYFWEQIYPLLNYTVNYNSMNTWIIILLIFIVVVIPIMLLLDWGFHFISYLRGASDKYYSIFELVYDYITAVTFFLRINIQLIRLLIGAFVFSFFDQYFLEGMCAEYRNTINFIKNNSEYYDAHLLYINYFYYYFFRTIYEIGHMWMLLFIQTTAFFMIISILFQFLYIFFLIDQMEKYFLWKREKRAIQYNNKFFKKK